MQNCKCRYAELHMYKVHVLVCKSVNASLHSMIKLFFLNAVFVATKDSVVLKKCYMCRATKDQV